MSRPIELRVFRRRARRTVWEAITTVYAERLQCQPAAATLWRSTCSIPALCTVDRRRPELQASWGPSARALGGSADTAMIRIVLPAHLLPLAQVVERSGSRSKVGHSALILDALGGQGPMLRCTIRHHVSQNRRSFIRFFAGDEDLSR